MHDRGPALVPTPQSVAELSAHVEAATARLLDLIRDFDARGGWNTGFRSCAAWLSWRVGLDPGTARERVRVARALGALPLIKSSIRARRAGERFQVVVHVDAGALTDSDQAGQSVLEEGERVPAETSRRLACDASRVVMRHDAEGRVIDVGARTRTIPPALRRALCHRDRGCRFPRCGVRVAEAHHVRHWAHGGPTTLSNLALLCRRHHRAVHEEGYRCDRGPDGALRFRRPDGRPLPDVPLPPPVPADPVRALRAQHDGRGLAIDARTTRPGWTGERLDVVYAIDVLRPPTARGTPD